MRNLWWDGFFAESCETIWLQYFPLYALALGANVGLIGVLAALGNLLAALSMWPGAVLAERTRRYKVIVLLTGGVLSRLGFLLLAATPWIATGNHALALLVVVAALRGFMGSVAMPAWNAFAAEFVPPRLRGRYFSSRNFARQASGLAMAPLAGLLIAQTGLVGWQVAWLMAFGLGMVSTVFYMRIPNDAAAPSPKTAPAPKTAPSPSMLRDRRLLWLVGTTGLFQLSVMLAGPFFAVYFVQEMGASTMWVGLTAAMMPLAGIIAQPLLGRLNDRLGAKWLLVATGLVLPIAPWAWILATEPWHVLLINLLAGALWAGNLLAMFNLVLELAPPDRRPTYSGVQQAGIFFASFLGPVLGGLLIPLAGFHAVFFISGAGRAVATLALWRWVEVEEESQSRPPLQQLEPAAA